jgi:Tfp pilus assembly protein PilE
MDMNSLVFTDQYFQDYHSVVLRAAVLEGAAALGALMVAEDRYRARSAFSSARSNGLQNSLSNQSKYGCKLRTVESLVFNSLCNFDNVYHMHQTKIHRGNGRGKNGRRGLLVQHQGHKV